VRVLVFLLLLLGAASAAPLTPERLLTLPRVGEVRLSPDGRLLAVSFRSELKVYRVADRKVVAKVPKASHPRWLGDKLMVLKGGQAWAGPPGALKQVTKAEVHNAIWTPSGGVAYVAPVGKKKGKDSGKLYDDLFVRRWNEVYDGRRLHLFVNGKDVTPGDWDAYPTSGTFSSGDNFCFSPDGKLLFFSAPPRRGQASDTNYDIWKVELATGKRVNLTEGNPAADLGPRVFGGRLYALAHQRPGYESDFGRIRSCPLTALGEWQDEPWADPADFVPSEAGMYFTTYRRAAWRAHLGDVPLEPLQGSAHSLTASSSGKTWACTHAALNQPPRVLVNGKVFWEPPALTMGRVDSVTMPVEGADMQMFLIFPPGFDETKKWPVAYLIHGGPQGGWSDDWSYRWNAQLWAAQGYVVAMPNPRGSSGFGPAFQEQVSRDWGGRAFRDLMAGADYLEKQPYVDPSRILAAGASYGGYMVNWIAVHTDRFKALVTHCGVWNLESMYGTTDELWFVDWEFGGPPWGGSPDYQMFSPHRWGDKLKTPHFVIHNELDYRCPLDQGLQLFTALQRQGVPSKLLYFPDEGHHVLKTANGLRWYREVFAFLKRYCPPGPT